MTALEAVPVLEPWKRPTAICSERSDAGAEIASCIASLSCRTRPVAAIGRLAWMLPLQPALQSFATPKKICGTLTSRLHLDVLNSPIGN